MNSKEMKLINKILTILVLRHIGLIVLYLPFPPLYFFSFLWYCSYSPPTPKNPLFSFFLATPNQAFLLPIKP